ncbi:hypothetical protein L1887_38920 [Cichorium endivia]|nr:hypothetical protein L1887_38920 [Cichorium endivia]
MTIFYAATLILRIRVITSFKSYMIRRFVCAGISTVFRFLSELFVLPLAILSELLSFRTSKAYKVLNASIHRDTDPYRRIGTLLSIQRARAEFKNFGIMWANGIQVRSSRASPVSIGECNYVVEEKRSTISRDSDSIGGGFTNECMRGRENQNDYGYRSGGCGRAASNSGGSGYQSDNNGGTAQIMAQ